jgi:hypothetical protein
VKHGGKRTERPAQRARQEHGIKSLGEQRFDSAAVHKQQGNGSEPWKTPADALGQRVFIYFVKRG